MKNCRDCKYCMLNGKSIWEDTCGHPDAVFIYCAFERDDLGSTCGEEGRLFEKKED